MLSNTLFFIRSEITFPCFVFALFFFFLWLVSSAWCLIENIKVSGSYLGTCARSPREYTYIQRQIRVRAAQRAIFGGGQIWIQFIRLTYRSILRRIIAVSQIRKNQISSMSSNWTMRTTQTRRCECRKFCFHLADLHLRKWFSIYSYRQAGSKLRRARFAVTRRPLPGIYITFALSSWHVCIAYIHHYIVINTKTFPKWVR